MKRLIIVASFFLSFNVFSQNYELLFLQEDYDSIMVQAEKFENSHDYFWYSKAILEKGDYLKAISVLEEGNDAFQDVRIAKLLANSLFNTGQYNKALPILELHNDDPEMLIKQVRTLEFYDKNQSAINLLKNSLEKDSLNINSLELLARIYTKIDSIDLAITNYEKLIDQNPNNQLVMQRLINLYIQNKQYTEAIELCDYVLYTDSCNLKFIKLKGIASFVRKDFPMAEWCFQDLVDNGDSTILTLKNLGISQYNLFGYDDAIENLSIVFKKNDKDFEAVYFLGLSHLKRNEAQEGLDYLKYAEKLLEPNPIILSTMYIEKALFYTRIREFNKAVDSYEIAFNHIPKPEHIFYIAEIYRNDLKDYDKALRHYEKFLELLKDMETEKIDEEQQNTISISLKESAEYYIKKIKEDNFWDGR